MPNFSRNRSKSPSATLFDDSVYVCSNSVLAISAGSVGGASGDASHSTRSPFSWWCSFFYPFICLINKISYVIKVISHLIYLRPIILCPVGFYGLFTLVFECSIPDILDDFSEFLATLFGGHEMRLTDKYINIAVHTIIEWIACPPLQWCLQAKMSLDYAHLSKHSVLCGPYLQRRVAE